VVDGISVTTAARTLLDLGAVHDSSVVEMALERALRRELVTTCELSQLVRALGRRGRNGVGVLRQLVETRDPAHAPTESDMETRLRRVLRRHGLPEPVPQFVIRDDAGHFVARVDFAYPEQRIAIEYDSFEHHTGTVAHVRDHSRRNRIEGLHWAVIVATVADIRSGGDQLAQTLRNRLAPPSLPFGVEKPRWSA
jgi:very-short-patch-repair endonuclease